jgi:uncharacterized membrane protein YccF (DUF307 family)
MPIDVTCPGCKARFQVSEKFAGKKGPCPKCKTPITIPTPKEQVVIHAPETDTVKDKSGQPVFKPILRQETRLSQPVAMGIGGAVFAVLFVAFILRFSEHPISPVITSLGAILLAPPLVMAGYAFLRDDELEPYRNVELWLRVGLCSAVYALLWGGYWFVFSYLHVAPEFMHLIFVIPVAIAVGTVAAIAAFDLEFGQAALHYAMYLVATILLRLLMGMNGLWDKLT